MLPVNAAVRAARPTLNLDGRDRAELSDGLLGMSIVENLAGLYRCEAMFGNWGATGANGSGGSGSSDRIGWVYFDRQTLDFGKPLKVIFEGETLFDGRIMGLEALFPETGVRGLNVLAEDRFQDLRMTRRTRAFVNKSDSDIVNQIAQNHSLRPQVDLPSVTHKVLAQVNQSDLAFLRDRARSVDAEVWMEGDTLHAVRHSSRRGQPVELTYREELREFSALADLANQRSAVTVAGWDVSSKQAITYEAGVSAIQGELNGDVSGVSILQSALGERKEQLSHTVPLDSTEAQYEAEAFFRMSARRFVTARGLADVQPQLHAGTFVQLKELGPLFSGKYYVTEVRHVFDRTGLRTEFSAERAGDGETLMLLDSTPFEAVLDERLPSGLGGNWYGVYPALVTDIVDPDGQGRVKVKLPWSPDTGSDGYEVWARPAMLMAGNNRGTWFIPDVDDEVLVAFEGGNPVRPYVLGMLWNGRDATPASMDRGGQNNSKLIRSRNGVKITLDDQDGQEKLIVETPGGQKMTLQDGPGTVTIEDSNGNSIKMEASGITINTSGQLTLNASMVTIGAGSITANAGTSTFNGMLIASTCLQTPSVIAASYTPGAGNIW